MPGNVYAIMGATGHIGRVICDELLKKGHLVKAIGRNSNKLQALADRGAKTFSLPFDNAAALAEVFEGCNAAFSFIPPGYKEENLLDFQDQIGKAITQALTKAKVPFVVNLSSIGAHLEDSPGPIFGLHKHENRLNSIPNFNVLHFRPGYFMENLFWSIPAIKKEGINKSPLRQELKLSLVATKDIGVKVAEFLNNLKFNGKSVYEFVGPQLISMQEVNSLIGKAIGKPNLKYYQYSEQESKKAMLATGMKESLVNLMAEMHRAINAGEVLPTQEMTEEHQGKISAEEFINSVFLKTYNASQPAAAVARQ